MVAGWVRPQVLAGVLLGLSAAGLWLACPWIAPHWPPFLAAGKAQEQPGRDLIVVLDGGASRLAQAERFRQLLLQKQSPPESRQEPEWLLIRCPRGLPPDRPITQLLEGYDTVTQMTALADWLQRRQAPPPQRVWIATDPAHTARATLLAQLALGRQGIAVLPADPPPPVGPERRKLWRDALRLSLWRATGSTGAELVPQTVQRKRNACGL